jgi:hypothetical protein
MKSLLSALQRLYEAPENQTAASQFTKSQRQALDRFIQQTQALRCITSGRGVIYKILQPQVVEQHLRSLNPTFSNNLPNTLPNRAANIAHSRNSKSSHHRHSAYYLLMRACGEQIQWSDTENQLHLSEFTARYGVAALEIEPGDSWRSDQPLWLVENQALFDVIDWLPEGIEASIHWYRGQLNNNLLDWLAARERAPEIVLFPDYDGVGLHNFIRLHQRLGNRCSLWLMPDWQAKLEKYGSNEIWLNTKNDFEIAGAYLSKVLSPTRINDMSIQHLLTALRTQGRALEQEAIWL